MLRMARFNQSSQHTDYIMVKHPVIAVLTYMKLITICNDKCINITCLVSIDQFFIFFRNRLNINNFLQTVVPVLLHMRIMLIKRTLSCQNCICRISINTAKPICTDTVFPHYRLTRLNCFHIFCCIIEGNQIAADCGQKLNLFTVIHHSHP